MPRPPKTQTTMFDRKVDDGALQKLLEEQVRLEPDAKEYRATKKSIRQLIETEHPELLEDGDDDSGWVLCGPYRFRPRKTDREEGEVKIGAGINWSCPVERV